MKLETTQQITFTPVKDISGWWAVSICGVIHTKFERTKTTAMHEARRYFDWAIHEHGPKWFGLTSNDVAHIPLGE